MSKAIIGVDPHKLSVTIEVVDEHEKFLGSGNGVGRPLAQRLLEAGEQVVDVPAKLAARVRLFDMLVDGPQPQDRRPGRALDRNRCGANQGAARVEGRR
jgi:hypothetical protein